MGVPATLADLDVIIANNSPSGSDPIGTQLDDYLRAHAGLIKQVNAVAAAAVALLPAGTRLAFAQSIAPTGWTQDVSANATNRMLRVVNTVNATTFPGVVTVGGTDSPIINSVVPSHAHTLNINSGTQSANHTHDITNSARFNSGSDGPIDATSAYASAADGVIETRTTTNESVTHYHNVSGTTATNAGAANWSPKYIDMIIAVKN